MDNIKHTRHSRYLLMYHMVWIPKYRRRILVGPVAERLKEIILALAAERDWEVLAQEVMSDHVHVFASAPPPISPADLVKVFKGITARLLLKEFPTLAKRTGRGTLWAPSYFIGTAGHVSAAVIERYIAEQGGE